MPSVIYDKLDPLFETMGLIYFSRNLDEARKETVSSLDELGLDGDKFYAAHFTVFEEYVQGFQKHYKPGDNDALFFDGIEIGLLLLFMCLLLENREQIDSVDQFKDSEINKEIIDFCGDLYDFKPEKNAKGLDEILAFIEKCSLTECEKWKLLQIMKSPKIYMKQLAATISANIPAFEKAQDKVQAPLKKLIAQYLDIVKNGDKELFGRLKGSLSKTADVYPTLAFSISQLMFQDSCYYGLLSTLLVSQNGPDQGMLLRCLKALSDGSRLEILRSLKQKPKYNLEIAEQLGLTAATMSHHMGVLLTCGFVSVSKQESKVYYHIEEQAVRRFIESIEQILI